jgi:glucosamine-6-phosphate deaminase
MEIIIKPDYDAMSEEMAGIVLRACRKKKNLVLGLPTGNTPVGLYARLSALHGRGELDLSEVVTFNLDEYVGLGAGQPQSFARFMNDHLFGRVNLKPENIHLLPGTGGDIEEHCRQYEMKIRSSGGIDLQILGIGADGHIAFNLPGSSLVSRTRLLTLTREMTKELAPHFEKESDAPRFCLTMGVGTILEARSIVLIANGRGKAESVARAIEGPVTASCPASALQLHPDVTLILDEDAASGLKNIDYYRWTAENKPAAAAWLGRKTS